MEAIAQSRKPTLGGFIHVPAKGMPIETIAEGLAIATKVIADRLAMRAPYESEGNER